MLLPIVLVFLLWNTGLKCTPVVSSPVWLTGKNGVCDILQPCCHPPAVSRRPRILTSHPCCGTQILLGTVSFVISTGHFFNSLFHSSSLCLRTHFHPSCIHTSLKTSITTLCILLCSWSWSDADRCRKDTFHTSPSSSLCHVLLYFPCSHSSSHRW